MTGEQIEAIKACVAALVEERERLLLLITDLKEQVGNGEEGPQVSCRVFVDNEEVTDPPAPPEPPPPRDIATGGAHKPRGRGNAKEKSKPEHAMDVLVAAGEPLSVDAVQEGMKAAGVTWRSDDPRRAVLNMLSVDERFMRTDVGMYDLSNRLAIIKARHAALNGGDE